MVDIVIGQSISAPTKTGNNPQPDAEEIPVSSSPNMGEVSNVERLIYPPTCSFDTVEHLSPEEVLHKISSNLIQKTT
jgi:hypothetical protein